MLAKLKYKDTVYQCDLELALDIVNGKWKGLVLWHLSKGIYTDFLLLIRIYQEWKIVSKIYHQYDLVLYLYLDELK